MEHNLEDIGLELTFSVEDHSFGRSQTIDLIPGGRKIPVTEDSKQRYVELVCQHRMTTAIEKQVWSLWYYHWLVYVRTMMPSQIGLRVYIVILSLLDQGISGRLPRDSGQATY